MTTPLLDRQLLLIIHGEAVARHGFNPARGTFGPGTRANATVRPQVTLVFPSPEPGAFSLIVDGTATVHDDGVTVSPSLAVLHRPAIPIDGG